MGRSKLRWRARRGSAMVERRKGLRDVPPYRAPQLDVPARLNTNECPYALPDGFRDELAEAVRVIAFNRYPDRDCVQLREALAAHTGHPVDGVWPANGSNEIIQQLLLAYGGPGRRAVLFTPTYVLHSHLAWMTHTDVATIDTPEPFTIGEERSPKPRRSRWRSCSSAGPTTRPATVGRSSRWIGLAGGGAC